MKKIIILICLLLIQQLLIAQENLEEKFEELSKTETGYNELVQINVSHISLHDFITALGNEHKINVSVDTELNQKIINNFYNVKVKEVFLFLIKKYNLEVKFLGKIVMISKREEVPLKKKKKRIDIKYDLQKKVLSANLVNDSLYLVTKEITNLSGENIVVHPAVKVQKITSYVLDKPLEVALKIIAESNDLDVEKNKEQDYYYLKKKVKKTPIVSTKKYSANGSRSNKINRKNDNLIVKLNADGTVDVIADEVPLIDIIYNVALKAKKDYFLYSKIDSNLKSSFAISGMSFDKILEHTLIGTRYTYKKSEGYYLIGEKTAQNLRQTELIRLKNRTVEDVVNVIPSKITSGLEIKEFKELNGLIVSGDRMAISEIKTFLSQIDEKVPVVQIEVIIFQQEKSNEVQTGLQAGFDANQQTSSLTSVFPTTDVKLNSKKVNELIDSFNGLGIFNLGKVPDSFFLSLKALENNAVIKLESTPKIATLNGHEANLKIGSTSYYFEQTNTLLTSNNNNDVLQSGQWRPTEANLSLKVKPFVSKDESITLNLRVEKSAFTGRVGENAPPGKSTQQFESLIRVNNGDMVLLGGLDEVENNDSGTGTPFLSRIPIIKWFFSGRKKKKGKKKLHILIKPTVYFQ